MDEIYAKVVAHVARHAPEVEVIWQGGMDPSKTPIDSPYTEPLRQAILSAQGVEPLLVPAMGGSLPNYVFTKMLGLPAFTVPYANADEANHAPNEKQQLLRAMRHAPPFDTPDRGCAAPAHHRRHGTQPPQHRDHLRHHGALRADLCGPGGGGDRVATVMGGVGG